LDDRELIASEIAATAQIELAQAQFAIEEGSVRKLESQLKRLEAAGVPAVSVEDLENRRNDLIVARARTQAARAQITVAQAELQRLRLLIERLTVLLRGKAR